MKMKMKRLFILGLMLVIAVITHAADILKVQDVEITPGKSVTLNIELNNSTTNLMGWQCDISFPEGLTLELKDNGKPAVTLGDRFSATEHTISSNSLFNGDYRFIATSIDGEAIPGTSGTLFKVTLKADASLTLGTKLTGTIKKIEFNTQDNQKLIFDDVQFFVTIDNPLVITVKNQTRIYGEANPVFEFDVEGGELSGTPEISCEATAASPVGTYDIIISKGSVTNSSVTYINGTLTITKAPLKITAKDYTIKQGEPLPTFEATYEGFKNNETSAVLTKQPTISTTATSASEPGEYAITVSGAKAQNYEISYVKGKLTIGKADALTVTAKSYTIAYGDDIPKLEYTSKGATLKGTPTITCEAKKGSPVGTYDIIISKGSVTNYNDTYVNGKLTITKAPLKITAKDYTIKQGEPLPTFEATYEGFKINETSAVLTKQPTISTTATSASEPGEYAITVSGAKAQNYEISYVKGKLTIQARDLIPGDANSDGEVNVADVDYVIEHIGEALDATNKAADVNGDGEINVADVDYIIERIA